MKEMAKQLEEMETKLKKYESPTSTKKNKIPTELARNLETGITKKTGPYGVDAVKAMIKAGEIGINDTGHQDKTLLIMAAIYGSFDLAQFLINNVCCLNCALYTSKMNIDCMH